MSQIAVKNLFTSIYNIKLCIRVAEFYIIGCNNIVSIWKYYKPLQEEIIYLVNLIKDNKYIDETGIKYLRSIEDTLKKIYLGVIKGVNDNLDKIKLLDGLYKRSGLITSQRFLDELRRLSDIITEFKIVYNACGKHEMYIATKNTINNFINLKISYIDKLRIIPRERGSISQGKKFKLWKAHIGENWFGLCVCCKITKISIENFIVGHVLAVDAGGDSALSNLRPICQRCNSDMGTAHMDDYIEYLRLTKK
ncbi:HNH endonuclease [Faustovirus]|nr:HNH endonuclease [Faustovirus]AMN84636.1 HNH endonuclease [Faustovirus]AMP44229.1 HNH endonuclease [Faustovirus]